MIVRDVPIRVRYYETDCMGIVHHSNYVRYYEVARTEMLREFGTTYQEMEASGVMLPVLSVETKYITPAYDDDLLTVRVIMPSLPTVRLTFEYEVYRGEGELINTGRVQLAFMRADTRKGCRPPAWFLDLLRPHFEQK